MNKLLNSLSIQFGPLLERYGINDSQWPRETVWHYTTALGLKGILEHKVLWASHFGYMNDISEIRYGRNLIADAFENHALAKYSLNSNFGRLWYKTFLESASQIRQNPPVDYYVASFCKSGNQLSQWRAYGGQGGYSIGFKFKEWNFHFEEPSNSSVSLFNILYESVSQIELAQESVQLSKNLLRKCHRGGGFRSEEDVEDFRQQFVKKLSLLLVVLALRMKDPAFAEEQESRLLTLRTPDSPSGVKFRELNGILVPYVEIPLNVPEIEIVSVQCGPTHQQPKAKQSVDMMLKQYGWENVEVLESLIPLGR